MWGPLLCIIGSQRCLLFNLPPPGVGSSNKLLLCSKLGKQFLANIGKMYKKFNSIWEVVHIIKRGGCTTARRDISGFEDCFDPHKTFYKPNDAPQQCFIFLCLQYSARMVISWLITWEIPPQTFEINLLSSYLTEETWGPCQWSSVWWDLKIFIREWR